MMDSKHATNQARNTRALVKKGLEEVQANIARACQDADRPADDVALVAVTKYTSTDAVEALVDLGHLDMGENYAQNLVQRVQHFDIYHQNRMKLYENDALPEIRWHMIGHLQRNKVKMIAPLCALIHGVDNLRLANEISNWGKKHDIDMHILIQINASEEENKSGCPPIAATALAREVSHLPNICLRGLMSMGPANSSPELAFEKTNELYNEIQRATDTANEHFNVLSMGMSQDYMQAIAYGANVVRVGSAIFNYVNQDQS